MPVSWFCATADRRPATAGSPSAAYLLSRTTPTISRHGPAVPPKLTRLPSGSSAGKCIRANVSFTIDDGRPPSVSWSLEIAARHERDAERLEEPRPDDVGVDDVRSCRRRRRCLRWHTVVRPAGLRRAGSSTRPPPVMTATRATLAASTPGSRLDPLDHVTVELAPLCARVAQQVDVERRRHQPGRHRSPGSMRLRPMQAADEQPGGDQQQQRQRDFDDDQHVLQVEPARARSSGSNASSLSAGTSPGRDACSAGATPNTRPVTNDSASVNSEHAHDRPRTRARGAARRRRRRRLERANDGPRESDAGAAADRAPTARSRSAAVGRAGRGSRRAPAARRARAAATPLCESSRFAMFAHAISSTAPTTPPSSVASDRICCR